MQWKSYRKEMSAVEQPRPLSQLAALEQIRTTQAELAQSCNWPEHLTAWLQEHYQAMLQAIRKATKDIDHACLNQDSRKLDRALAEYKAAWLDGLDLWIKHHV